jgi:hypothetical protein
VPVLLADRAESAVGPSANGGISVGDCGRLLARLAQTLRG